MSGTTRQFRDRSDIALRVEDLRVSFPVGRQGTLHAVSGVSFDVAAGETLGIVGESGCGKSSTGKAIIQLPAPTGGSVQFDGVELTALQGEALRRARIRLQMIFQDPISSLNPRRRIRDIVAEGLVIWGWSKARIRARVDEVMHAVGLDPAVFGDRRPHEFSGGQCQRICIARALALEPSVLICDEPVSALDVSVQAQILNLLEDMKQRFGLTMVFIAHDLAVVKNISDRVAVMYLGKICELGDGQMLFQGPAHPYTQALIASIPVPDPDARTDSPGLGGDLPSPLHPPPGCRFHTRCPRAQDRCRREQPELRELAADHYVACHFPGQPGATATAAEFKEA